MSKITWTIEVPDGVQQLADEMAAKYGTTSGDVVTLAMFRMHEELEKGGVSLVNILQYFELKDD